MKLFLSPDQDISFVISDSLLSIVIIYFNWSLAMTDQKLNQNYNKVLEFDWFFTAQFENLLDSVHFMSV